MDIHGIAPLLQVFDMPTAIRIYRDVPGSGFIRRLSPATTAPGRAYKLNGAELMLNTTPESDQRAARCGPGAGRQPPSILVCFSAARNSTRPTSTCAHRGRLARP